MRVLADPAVRDLRDGNGVEVVPLLATDLLRRDEIGVLEDREVFHHGKPGDVGEERDELTDGLSVTLEQGVEDGSPSAVGERPEDGLLGVHGSNYVTKWSHVKRPYASAMTSLVLRRVRIVRIGDGPAPEGVVDLRIVGDRVVEVAPHRATGGR